MAAVERLRLLLQADTKGAVTALEKVGKTADRELSRTDDKMVRTSKTLQKFGAGALLVAGTAAVGLYKAAGAASELEQAVGGTEAVFKEAAARIEEVGKSADQSMGLSERAFREATTSIGGNLKRMGFGIDDAAERSIELTQVAADLAATYGGTTAEAVDALGAAFRGEADPAERFNLNLKIGAVNAKAVALGLAESEREVSENAKAQALLALITEQSADAQGQFAREADTAAGAMQRASAAGENAQASLGEALAPIMADVADNVAGLANKFVELNDATGGAASKVLTYGTIALGAVGATAAVTGKVLELSRSLKSADLAFSMSTRSMAAFAAAGISVGLAIKTYSDQIEKSNRQVDEHVAAIVGGFDASKASAAEFEAQYAKLEEARRKFTEAGNNAINPELIRQHREAADAILAEQMAMKGTGDQAAILMDQLGITADEALRMATSSDVMAGAVDEATGEIDGAAAAANDAEKALSDLADELESMFNPLFGAQDAMNDLADAQRDAAEAAKEHGASSREAAEANDKVVRAALKNESAQLKLASAIAAGEVKVDDSIATLNRWVAEGSITQEQANFAALAFSELGSQADTLSGRHITIPVTANTTAFERAIANLYRARDGVRISVGGGGGVPVRANGGPIPGRRGQAVPTIAHGGEFVLSADVVDSIKRGRATAGLPGLSAAGGGVVYNINASSISDREVARMVRDAIESARRSGV